MELDQFLEEAFREITRGAKDKRHPYRYLVFNTMEKHNPDTRMVVCRDFDRHEKTLLIYTDKRSNKVQQLKITPEASILFWHPGKRLQVKFIVNCEFLSGEDRTLRFDSLRGGKESYNTLQSPSSEVDHVEEGRAVAEGINSENFSVIKCNIQEAEVLRLNNEGHTRARYTFLSGELNHSTWLVP